MNKKLQDNKFAFVFISIISIAISAFGVIANSIYFEYAGYSVGMACTVLLFTALCLIYSQVNPEVKRRTIDMFFISLFVVGFYSIITLLVDISQIRVIGFVGIAPMGIIILVFVGLIWAATIWQLVRLILDIFGIRITQYEELLKGNNPFKNLFKKKQIAGNEEISANIDGGDKDISAKANNNSPIDAEIIYKDKTIIVENLQAKGINEEEINENKKKIIN